VKSAPTTLAQPSKLSAYVTLTKPDVSFLVLMTTGAGYYMGARGPIGWLHMIHVIVATMMIAAGTAALNHYIERESDRYMRRTASRPLPTGVAYASKRPFASESFSRLRAALISISQAGFWPCFLGVFHVPQLSARVHAAEEAHRLGHLHRRHSRSHPADDRLDRRHRQSGCRRWLLFAILFVWQFPHFHAIAWMYREDYARAGILNASRRGQGRPAHLPPKLFSTAAALVAVSLLPPSWALAGVLYFFGALVTCTGPRQVCLWAAHAKTNTRAKWLMHATVLHIPILLGLMMYDKIPR